MKFLLQQHEYPLIASPEMAKVINADIDTHLNKFYQVIY